ncbi:cytochrome P450 [Nocardia tengchongensis]|uniref:cytochrome P450 n=1 Tax=Nocardia tengchongensis TaxID=2055889 RepID=UPI003657CCF5
MTDLLSPLREGVGIDYVADVAKPFSIRVLGKLLGIPVEDDEKLIGWVSALLADDFAPNAEANAESAVKDMGRYVMELVTARGENLGDDLVSDFIRHDGLSYLDVVTVAFGLIIAGFESTAHMLSKMVFQLLIRPDLWTVLTESPDRIPSAVDELLRTISLGGGEAIPWLVREPVSLGGVDMAAGDYVMPSTGAANRDGLVFDDPDQIVFGRSQKQHLTFGYGTSYCLGSQVAKVELEVGLGLLVREYPGLRLTTAPESIGWPAGSAVWRLAELPVALP